MKILKTVYAKFLARTKNGKQRMETEDEDVKDDYIAQYMGSFGVYQLIVCTIAGLSRFSAMWNMLSSILIIPKTVFKCNKFNNNTSVEVKNSTCYNDCVKYEYYQEVFQSTVISRFELICDRSWLADFAQILFLFGVLFGAWFFGWIADRQGRRVSLRLASFINIIFLLIAGFSVNFWMFAIIRFILGITSGAIFVISTVYVLEVVGSNHREIAVCWVLLTDGVAEAMMTIFAYCSSTWDIFILEYFAVSVLLFLLILVLPETPRWYISQGKVERAVEVAMKAAICNNQNTNNIEQNMRTYIDKSNVLSQKLKTEYMNFLWQTETMKNTFCVIVMFTQVGIGLCCTQEYIGMLVPNSCYTSLIFLGFIQISAGLLLIAVKKIFGRRTLLIIAFFVNMVSVLVFYFLPKDRWVSMFTVAIVHGSIIIALAAIFIFTAEMYPTPIRSFALGVGTTGLVIGAIMTPHIVHLKVAWVFILYFSICSFIALSFCTMLPDKKGCNLKDNIK